MSDIVLKAQRRATGKTVAKSLRRSGLVPGVYYMNGAEPISIVTTPLALRPAVYTSESHVIHLHIEGESNKLDCILKDFTFDPVSDKLVHFDLQGLSADRLVVMEVPVLLKGQNARPHDGGIVQHILHKVEIECLPVHIPEHIDVDVAKLSIGDSIHLADLKVDNIKFTGNGSTVVVAVLPPTVEHAAATGGVTEPEIVGGKGKKPSEG